MIKAFIGGHGMADHFYLVTDVEIFVGDVLPIAVAGFTNRELPNHLHASADDFECDC
jgi:hypothetical protein